MHCGDVNPLVSWADRVGAHYLRQIRPDHSMYWSDGGWLDTAAARQANTVTGEAFGAVYAAAAQGDDVAISDVLPDPGRWARGVRHILQLMTSEDPEYVSAEAYADYEDTDVNWPVISGYGDLITRLASGLPVRLGVAVESVEGRSGGVWVSSAQGEIRAGAAIVTTSTNVLNAGGIRFGPGPARDLLEKIAEVPCGAYEKVAIALRRPVIGEADALFCMIDPGDGASPADFQVHGPERRVLIAHLAAALPARSRAADRRRCAIMHWRVCRWRLALMSCQRSRPPPQRSGWTTLGCGAPTAMRGPAMPPRGAK